MAISRVKMVRARIVKAFRAVAQADANGIVENTANITPEAGQALLNDVIKRKKEKTGKVMDCFIRLCPELPPTGSHQYDTKPLGDFITALREIQDEMKANPAIPPRRMQLLLNFNKEHWTTIDFEVSAQGIKCLMLDAVQYGTMKPELKELAAHLNTSGDQIYQALGPRDTERLQKYYSCFIFSLDHLRKIYNETNLYTRLAERATVGESYAADFEAIAKGLQLVRWTAFPPAIYWNTELLSRNGALYSQRNPLQAGAPANNKRHSYNQRIGPGGSKLDTAGTTNLSVTHLMSKTIARGLKAADEIQSVAEVDFAARLPKKHAEYLLECEAAEKIHDDALEKAQQELSSKDPAVAAAAKTFLNDVMNAQRPRDRDTPWGNPPLTFSVDEVKDEINAHIEQLMPKYCDNRIKAYLYAAVIDQLLKKCSSASAAELQQIAVNHPFTVPPYNTFVAELAAKDPNLETVLRQFADDAFQKLGDKSNARGNIQVAANMVESLITKLSDIHAIHHKNAETYINRLARGATPLATTPFDQSTFNDLMSTLVHIINHEENLRPPNYDPADLKVLKDIIQSSDPPLQRYYELSLALCGIKAPTGQLKVMLEASLECSTVKGVTVGLGAEKRTIDQWSQIATQWRDQQLASTLSAAHGPTAPGPLITITKISPI